MASYCLTTLGALALTRDGLPVEGPAAQVRRLALLAALAGTPRGISRDVLADLLWTDAEPRRARHSLDQALSALRRALGADPFRRAGAMLTLDRDVVSSDVAAFDAAVANGMWKSSVAVYAGDFLEGIHLRDAGEFERWADRERLRRKGTFAKALEEAARETAADGDWQGAIALWRRRREVDPLSGRLLIELARALEASGDRAAALREAQAYVDAVRAELGEAPDAAVLSLVEELGHLTGGRPGDGGSRGDREIEREIERVAAAARPNYAVDRPLSARNVYRTYLGRELDAGKAVHLKVLAPEVLAGIDPRRFLRELGRTVGLTHPNVVAIDDAFSREGLVVLVHEAVEEETLRDRLRRQPAMPPERVSSLALEIGAALGYVHANGVLHLDLAPRRILAGRRHRVLDFGVATAIRASSTRAAGESAVLFGNRWYMSPEVLTDARAPDERSDIFSFAAVLLHVLTGEPPRRSAGMDAAVCEDVPRVLRNVRPNLSPSWGRALSRALAPLPADRFSSVDAFLDALGIR